MEASASAAEARRAAQHASHWWHKQGSQGPARDMISSKSLGGDEGGHPRWSGSTSATGLPRMMTFHSHARNAFTPATFFAPTYVGALNLPTANGKVVSRISRECHFLLYLNDKTFADEMQGESLYHDLSFVLEAGISLVVVHEREAERGAMPFDHFYQITPEDLVRRGVYRDLATPWHSEPLARVSRAVAAANMGACRERKHRRKVERNVSRKNPILVNGRAGLASANAVRLSAGHSATREGSYHQEEAVEGEPSSTPEDDKLYDAQV
mmetsp:Transcript_27400/g.83339  ORF Transcript_27400/g.83339 Transcript_27400/m.83339 type:complete len:268 (-) Transcript_27400:731-1534(-)